jgi:hypothetical protein
VNRPMSKSEGEKTMLRPRAMCGALLCCAVWAGGCGHDFVKKQAEAVQLHTLKFHSFLNREQVEAAVHENQAIELVAFHIRAGTASAADKTTAQDLERQTALLAASREQAAQNWFLLAQYYSTHRGFAQAGAIYRRIIDTYAKGGERLYADYAMTALRDLNILTMDSDATDALKSSTTLSVLQSQR